MIKTHALQKVRGETIGLTFTVKDEDGQAVDISGATAYLRVRPDPKAAPVIQLSSPSTGIELATPQTGSTKGQFTAAITPDQTASLEPGDYVWDAWIVEASGERHAVVGPSKLTLVREVSTIPFP
jgi:hypothetical protein